MKKILLALLLPLWVSAPAFSQDDVVKDEKKAAEKKIESLKIGSRIPELDASFLDVDGKKTDWVKLTDSYGNGLLVIFSCNTCPYVVKAQQRTREMAQLARKNGIRMIIFNSNEGQRKDEDSPQEMARYAKAQAYTVPYLVDENSLAANAFGATRTPEVFLFNKEGALVYKGAMEDNPSTPSASKEIYLSTAMTMMLQDKQPEPAETKSIGCSIKRIE